MADMFLLAILPYISLSIFLVFTIHKYFSPESYRFTSLSSEFLEGKKLFWGIVPFHIGMITLFYGHLIGFLFPQSVIAFGRTSLRLLLIVRRFTQPRIRVGILKIDIFIIISFLGGFFGLISMIYIKWLSIWYYIFLISFVAMMIIGFLLFIKRKMHKLNLQRVVTSISDLVVLFLLLTQVVLGVLVAIFYRWGSMWYASTLSPYMMSIFTFSPNLALVQAMPILVKLHIITAMIIVALIPFTRLIHFLVYPIQYIWRGYQLVIWHWDRKKIKAPHKN